MSKFKKGDRVISRASGRHGAITIVKAADDDHVGQEFFVQYDGPASATGVVGAWLSEYIMDRETFFQFLFCRKGYFGYAGAVRGWAIFIAFCLMAIFGIVGVLAGWYWQANYVLLFFGVLMNGLMLRSHYRNFKGKQA